MKPVSLLLSVFALALAPLSVGCSTASSDPPASTGQDSSGDDELNAARSDAAPVGREANAKLGDLAPKVTLGFLGEDSGGPCTAGFRIGPAKDLSAGEALRLFGFNVEAQLASDMFEFHAQKKDDADFWDSFEASQWDEEGEAAAKEVRALFTSDAVTDLAIMIPEDDHPFGAKAYFLARMSDGSLLALRGDIGGMTL